MSKLVRKNFLHSHDSLQQSEGHEHVVIDRADWEMARRIFFFAESEEDARTQLNYKLRKVYEFCVILDAGTVVDDALSDRLYECGCEDGTVAAHGDRISIRFSRQAESLEDAIHSAVADVRKAGCVVKVVEV